MIRRISAFSVRPCSCPALRMTMSVLGAYGFRSRCDVLIVAKVTLAVPSTELRGARGTLAVACYISKLFAGSYGNTTNPHAPVS